MIDIVNQTLTVGLLYYVDQFTILIDSNKKQSINFHKITTIIVTLPYNRVITPTRPIHAKHLKNGIKMCTYP